MNILISSIDGMITSKNGKCFNFNYPVNLDNMKYITKGSFVYSDEKSEYFDTYYVVFHMIDKTELNWSFEDELTRDNRYEEIISYFKKLVNTKII